MLANTDQPSPDIMCESLYTELKNTFVVLRNKVALKSRELSHWSKSKISDGVEQCTDLENKLSNISKFTSSTYKIRISHQELHKRVVTALSLDKVLKLVIDNGDDLISDSSETRSEIADFWKTDLSLKEFPVKETSSGVGISVDFRELQTLQIPMISGNEIFNKTWTKPSISYLVIKCKELLKILSTQIDQFDDTIVSRLGNFSRASSKTDVAWLIQYRNIYEIINFLWLIVESVIVCILYVIRIIDDVAGYFEIQ